MPADTYRLTADVWSTLCRRAAASRVAVSTYVHDELVRTSRHPTIEDAMWELGEAEEADPSLEIARPGLIDPCSAELLSPSRRTASGTEVTGVGHVTPAVAGS